MWLSLHFHYLNCVDTNAGCFCTYCKWHISSGGFHCSTHFAPPAMAASQMIGGGTRRSKLLAWLIINFLIVISKPEGSFFSSSYLYRPLGAFSLPMYTKLKHSRSLFYQLFTVTILQTKYSNSSWQNEQHGYNWEWIFRKWNIRS